MKLMTSHSSVGNCRWQYALTRFYPHNINAWRSMKFNNPPGKPVLFVQIGMKIV